MFARGFVMITAVQLGLTAPALAQTVVHTLEWVEVHAGTATPVANPNGVLEPGEGALLRVAVEFDPIGTVITLPTISGTVAGLARSIFDLRPNEVVNGSWSNASVAAGFSPDPLAHGNSLGLFRSAGAFQSGTAPWVPDPINPIPLLWQAVWNPPSYEAREIGFGVDPSGGGIQGSSYIYIHYGTDPVTGHPLFFPVQATPVVNNAILIPIVPAPGSALVVLGILALRTRRVRS